MDEPYELLDGKEVMITDHLLEERKRKMQEMRLDPRKISYSMKLDPNVVFGNQPSSQQAQHSANYDQERQRIASMGSQRG